MSSRYWRLDGFGGVDLLRADASAHRYARHSHEGYALGIVEAGAHARTLAEPRLVHTLVRQRGTDCLLPDPGLQA